MLMLDAAGDGELKLQDDVEFQTHEADEDVPFERICSAGPRPQRGLQLMEAQRTKAAGAFASSAQDCAKTADADAAGR
jgi:hypothetical protein